MLKQFFAVAGAVIAYCAIAVPAARVNAAPASACNATTGVTVIVDFTHFGGNIERGCDPGSPGTALAAMQTAGFTTAGTARYGDAFVCRIDGRPSPKAEACTDTPSAGASWSFYYARPTDRAWTYSTTGVLSYQPASGTLIAFAFGNYAKPGVLPSGADAPTPTTTTTRPPRRTTVAPATPPVTALVGPTETTAPDTVATSVPATTPAASTSTTRGPGSTTTSTAARDTSTTTAPRIVDKTASGPVPDDDSGSPLPAIITIALVAGIGAGTFAMIRVRRRRAA